jgi:hypothetical protein
MAEKACHVFGSSTQVGLTQVLGCMESKFALRAIGIAVLFPTTMVAGFFSFLGIPFALDSIHHPNPVYPWRMALIGLLMAAGWFGIVTMWRMYYHYSSDRPLGNAKMALIGLISGISVAVALLSSMPGKLFVAWPLLGALYFLVRLKRSTDAA